MASYRRRGPLRDKYHRRPRLLEPPPPASLPPPRTSSSQRPRAPKPFQTNAPAITPHPDPYNRNDLAIIRISVRISGGLTVIAVNNTSHVNNGANQPVNRKSGGKWRVSASIGPACVISSAWICCAPQDAQVIITIFNSVTRRTPKLLPGKYSCFGSGRRNY